MIETVRGIPAHPLILHVVVVLVPLLVLVTLGYLVVPRLRTRLDWAVVLLALGAPLSALAARLSGLALRTRLIREQAVSAQDLAKISQHQSYGTMTVYFTAGLALAALLLVGYHVRVARAGRSGGLVGWLIGLVALVLSGFALYYVFRAGDTGAHIVWRGR